MSRELLDTLCKQERDAIGKAEAIALRAKTENRDMSEQENKDVMAYIHERKNLRDSINVLQPMVISDEEITREQQRSVQNPTDPPKTTEQKRQEAEEAEKRQDAQRKPSAQKRVFGSVGQQLRSIMEVETQKRVDPRLIEVQERAMASGLSENVNSEGGYMLEPELAADLLATIERKTVLYSRVMRRQVSGRSLRIYGLDENSKKKGKIGGGIVVYPMDEADAYVKSQPAWSKLDFDLKKVGGLVYLTDEELDDMPQVGQKIEQEFTSVFAYEIDGYLFEGDGVKVCEGMWKSPSKVTVAKESGQLITDMVNVKNLANMRARLLPGTRGEAVFLMNQEVEPALISLAIGNYPVFVPATGIQTAPQDRLFGIPIEAFDFCEAGGTEGDIVLAVPSQYLVTDKAQIQSQMSIHVRFLHDEKVLKFTYRFDGKSLRRQPYEPRKGTNKLSNVISLETRPAS